MPWQPDPAESIQQGTVWEGGAYVKRTSLGR